jgi:hypothetical protein
MHHADLNGAETASARKDKGRFGGPAMIVFGRNVVRSRNWRELELRFEMFIAAD